MHLVTGGSGFLGSNIARLLVSRGERVRVLDLWRSDDLHEAVEFVQADINDREAVEKAMRGVRHVHHNVALVPLAKAGDRYWKVNVEGTRVALEAARKEKVSMFCHMSSSAVFGSPDSMPITNDTPKKPVEIYGRAKLAGEQSVIQAGLEGLPVSIVRPRTIIGTGRLGIFQILFDWIRDGANIFTIGSGNHLFQFVHADDLAEASIRSCMNEVRGEFNVGTDRFGTLKDDLTFLCQHAATGSRVRRLPESLSISSLKLLDALGLSPLSPWHYLTYHKPFWFDSEPAFAALGYRPKYGNRELLTTSYDWFVANFDKLRVNDQASSHKRPVRQGILRVLKRMS
jgi:nucleoside-diphosphate-sugar epimerase